MRERLVPSGAVTVALVDGAPPAYWPSRATSTTADEQLYLHPNFVGRGIGTQLLAHARPCSARRSASTPSRATRSDCPDVLYEWR
jgi:GNAT superfamily N-acetyltransferase